MRPLDHVVLDDTTCLIVEIGIVGFRVACQDTWRHRYMYPITKRRLNCMLCITLEEDAERGHQAWNPGKEA